MCPPFEGLTSEQEKRLVALVLVAAAFLNSCLVLTPGTYTEPTVSVSTPAQIVYGEVYGVS
jgi:hypothetical protein